MTWIKEIEKHINELSDFQPADRLDYLAGIKKCNRAIAYAVNGWNIIVNEEDFVNALTGDGLKDFYEAWRFIALHVLKHDFTWKKRIVESARKTESAYVA